ncbi:hypothetical protein RDABS01_034378, partial [Bienertia sinuspersici]
MAKTCRQKTRNEPYTGEEGQTTQNDRKGNNSNSKPNANTMNDNRKVVGDDLNRDNDVEEPQVGESQIQELDKTNLNSWIEVMTGKGSIKQTQDITTEIETPMVTIDMVDIEEEITYWSSAMICFVLGLDKVSMMGRGLFLVRFNTLEQCDKALAGDPQFFDSKPLIMKRWNPDIEMHKENVKTVPIWIRMPNLELKYWGQGCLHKLGDIIGTTLKVDNVTLNKDRLAYARILVEVELDKELPDYIRSQNEKGILIQQYIEYEWRLTFCTKCKKYGHPSDKCNKQTKKQWQPKVGQNQQQLKAAPNQTNDTEQKAEERGQKDPQGFSPVQRKRTKPVDQVTPVTPIQNSFEALSSESEEEEVEDDSLEEGDQH